MPFLCAWWNNRLPFLHRLSIAPPSPVHRAKGNAMDLLYLLLIVGFSAVSIALVYGLERLRRPS
jgi:hypothetical protein